MGKQHKFQYLIPMTVLLVICLVIFILGTKYDYSLSKSIFDKNGLNIPVFSTIMCLVGPLVTNAFGAFAATALFFSTNRKSKFWHYALKVGAVLTMLIVGFFSYTAGTEFVEIIPNVSKTGLALGKAATIILIVAIDAVVGFFTWKNLKNMDIKKVFWVSLTMTAIIGVTAILGEVIKYLASRPRPRLIFTDNTFSFKEWYQWNPLFGFKEHECKSFISGHSVNAAATFSLLPLLLSVTKLNQKKYMTAFAVSLAGLYWLVIILSRILGTAHFLTDVSGAGIFAIFIQILVLFLMEKLKNRSGDFANN